MLHQISFISLVAISIIYLCAIGYAVIRRGVHEHTIRLLLFFLVTSVVWEVLNVLRQLASLSGVSGEILNRLPIYGVLLLAFLYFHLSYAFLRLKGRDRNWWSLDIMVMIAVLLLQGLIFLLSLFIPRFGQVGALPQQLGLGVLITGWVVFTGGVALITLRSYWQAQGPLHRNRIKYWLLALCLIVGGDAFLFAGQVVPGSSFRLAATLLITYAVSTYRLLDVSQIVRRIISYLVLTLLTVIFYLVGFVSMQSILQRVVLSANPLAPAAVTALMLAALFNPLLRLVQRLVDFFVFGRSYDSNLLVRQYSASISNILSLKRLTTLILRLIRRTLDIRYGTLFLVHRQKDEQDQDYFQLQAVKSHGKRGAEQIPPGNLQADGLVAAYLSQGRWPLAQYDIDLRPRFVTIPPEERAWLSSLNMEVYVPICAKEEWIGMLALGPKTSRRPYFDDDLAMLITLADQTAVALQNARLVDDLVKLNKDLNQAYHDLDRANQQLKELDNLKSSFIGVVTHELRSPFINVDFSLQLVERYGLDHLLPDQREQLKQLKVNIEATKQMVDNLVNFATFLSKQGEIQITQIDVPTVIEAAIFLNKPTATKKQITLHIDVPADLPVVSGDRQRLTDAVYQLVHNGVKFTQAEGQVWVRCRATADTMRFEVQDTGVGVPADKLPALWKSFAQMADPVLRGVEGMGLGLTLVQYVAHAHGGDVFAQSEVGVGSTFGFQIPLDGQT